MDWVVLTAAVTGLGLATMSVVSAGLEDLALDIQSSLMSTNVTTGTINPWDPSHPTYVACQHSDIEFENAVALIQDSYDNNGEDVIGNLDQYYADFEAAILAGTYDDNLQGRADHQCKIDVYHTVAVNNNLI